MSRNFLALLISVAIQPSVFAQTTSNSVVESPTAESYKDSSLAPANFQQPAPTTAPTSVPSDLAKPLTSPQSPTPAPRKKSLLGEQLNRITPKPTDHSSPSNSGCNCNSAVPASSVSYLSTMPPQSVTTASSPGYTTPIVTHATAAFPPPIINARLPALPPFYGSNQCCNQPQISRLKRGFGWRWRR